MKDRRRRDLISRNRFFFFALVISLSCAALFSFTFSTFRLLGVSFRPVLISSARNPALNAVNNEFSVDEGILRPSTFEIQETVIFPDQTLIFLKYPPTVALFTKADLQCVYIPPRKSQPHTNLPPISIESQDQPNLQIVRCPIAPRGFLPSLARNGLPPQPARPARSWDSLAYEALIDGDNTTVVFIKGLNLRPERIADASRYECVYGWDFSSPRFLLSSEALTVAQEIVRCRTPLSLLKNPDRLSTIKVSVRPKGRGRPFQSMARPRARPESDPLAVAGRRKVHTMCICSMVRNQARFLREWVTYHAAIGVERWFIYDNNSDDGLDTVVDSLDASNFNVSRHMWPWVKTQEAGFAHCALQARESCEWVGFIDVDEFLYFPSNLTLHDVLRNHSDLPWVGELRTACHSFGPSGQKRAPPEGVTVGYTCRMAVPERHKSIVRPEALNSTLINVVHHFHLKDGFEYVNMERGVMVINHYKYQVWEVFKEKFYRRVATYVVDWQDQENTGSKDRAPGLGTKAIEPPDWSSRFCDVTDSGLRDWVLDTFKDPNTGLLPWQEEPIDTSKQRS